MFGPPEGFPTSTEMFYFILGRAYEMTRDSFKNENNVQDEARLEHSWLIAYQRPTCLEFEA